MIVLMGVVLAGYFSRIFVFQNPFILMLVTLIGAVPVLWNAVQALRQKDWASMDMLASIALVFSVLDQEWVSAVFIAMMLAAARILGALTESRTERSIRSILKLRPTTAKVIRNKTMLTIGVEQVVLGDIIVVDAGERIPVDGTILEGDASVDESSLTGESLPIDKIVGQQALSSTLLLSGSLRIKTNRIGKDTTIERVIDLIASSTAEKPKTQTMGERFGKTYLVSVFIGSAVLYAVTAKLSLVLSVILVVCADDIAIAIPLAYLRAIGLAAKRGIIVKGGRYLEALGTATTFVFDKTGTLTKGALAVSGVVAVSGIKEEKVLAAAATASYRSSHPFSKAIVRHAKEQGLTEIHPKSFRAVGGKGTVAQVAVGKIVTGKQSFLLDEGVIIGQALFKKAERRAKTGESVSYVAINGKVVGFITAADEPKANAKQAIADLRSLGVNRIILLTGDNEHVAKSVASDLGVTQWFANLLPEDKVKRIKQLRRSGSIVMVGDGVNDAAALAASDIGIAMGVLGTDAAIESADIALMRDDLSALPEAVRLARATRSVAVQDFWIWGITNIFGLGLVFGGIIGPAGAAAYNFISDFFPLFNSLRVRLSGGANSKR